MFLLAQLGLIISLLLQSEGQSHGCSERLVVAHMGGSWPCLGDNKVLNLHDRYKNFAWGKPQESLGRAARRLSAEGRAWATTAGRSGAWAVGGRHPWGGTDARRHAGNRGGSPFPKRICFLARILTPKVLWCPSSEGAMVTPQGSLTSNGWEENRHRDLQTHARTSAPGRQ